MNHIHKARVILIMTILLQLITPVVVAQTVLDSLKQILLKPTTPVEEQVMTRLRMSKPLVDRSRQEAVTNTIIALNMSRSLKDPKYEALAHSTMVAMTYTEEDTAGVRRHLDSAFVLAEKSGDQLTLTNVWYRKGWLENRSGKPHEAVKSYLHALKLGEKLKDNIYEANIYYNLSSIYGDWNDRDNQYKYAWQTLTAARRRADPDDLCNAYQALASSFEGRFGNDTTQRAALDSALYYNRKAMATYEVNKSRVSFHSTMAIMALNTANIYDQYFPRSYRDSALHYLDIALKIGIATDQQEVIASTYGMRSNFAIADGDYNLASDLLLSGLVAMGHYSQPDNKLMAHFMEALSDVEEKKGDLHEALKYAREHTKYYTAAFNAERMAASKRLEAQYEAQKKERELASLQAASAYNRKLNIVYVVLIVACLIALLYIFRSYHFRLKSTIQQQQLLEKEKDDTALQIRLKEEEARRLQLEHQEAVLQARLQAEEAARLQAEQELMRAQKEQLQKDLLAGTLQVEQKNELLQTLQNKLSEKTVDRSLAGQITRMIDQHRRMDEDFEAAKTDLEHIHPEFFSRLQEKSGGTLTRLDLKHCSYIFMGLSTKEISSRMGVAPKSILMSRYRIKQKLGLGKEEGLDAFLLSVGK
ncbi:MAG TPA: hypothetical protein VM802_21805 [Chitinophaga sp.]|uniref:hypothetical protein n=1 Tax=Chitinophaga sp. TaxID=1869181 RepID=UPI002CF09413|nr:hypothetical protein [Chitinophaga sp.]HVI47521.1 hypothetical protein [Chitinophaga sp.]